MKATFYVDPRPFQAAMRGYQQATRKDMEKVIRDEMRLLCGDLVKLTPPAYGKGGAKDAQRMGEGAVAVDINKVFFSTGDKGPDVNRSLYESQRNARGRIPKGRRPNQPAGFRKIKIFIKEKMAHVGRAKAGWLSASYHFGFKSAPSWVKRHGTRFGSFVDRLHKSTGYLEAINKNKAIVTLEGDSRFLVAAMALRVRSIIAKTNRVLANRSKEFSAT